MNKSWIDQGVRFTNRPMKLWLYDNGIEMYSTHNEEKSVPPERFARNVKRKFRSKWLQYQKNVYVNILEEIVDKFHNTYSKNNQN